MVKTTRSYRLSNFDELAALKKEEEVAKKFCDFVVNLFLPQAKTQKPLSPPELADWNWHSVASAFEISVTI